eukprot:gene16135-30883_t
MGGALSSRISSTSGSGNNVFRSEINYLGKFQVSDLMTSHPGQTCSSLKITGETVTDGDIVGFLNTGHHHRAGNIAVEVREGEGTGGTILKSQKHSYATADGARRYYNFEFSNDRLQTKAAEWLSVVLTWNHEGGGPGSHGVTYTVTVACTVLPSYRYGAFGKWQPWKIDGTKCVQSRTRTRANCHCAYASIACGAGDPDTVERISKDMPSDKCATTTPRLTTPVVTTAGERTTTKTTVTQKITTRTIKQFFTTVTAANAQCPAGQYV